MMPHASTTSGTILSHSTSGAESRAFLNGAAVVLAVMLTAAAAQVTAYVPFTSVPFTLTPLAVMLTGAALGSRLGFVTQALYLAAGAAGFAVFAPSLVLPPGAGRLVGPTGGYLMAYPAAAFLTGWLAERGWDRRYLTSLASMLAGLAVIFLGGVSWLSTLPGQTISSAIATGFVPFVGLDLVKAAIAAQVLPLAWKLFGRTRQ